MPAVAARPGLTWQAVMNIVKQEVAAAKGGSYEWTDIFISHTLRGRYPDGLGFRRFEGLTRRLNARFAPYGIRLTLRQVQGLPTVGSLYRFVWSKLPAHFRENQLGDE